MIGLTCGEYERKTGFSGGPCRNTVAPEKEVLARGASFSY